MSRVKDMPVDSFGANLQAVLRQGANKEMRIKFPDKNMAVRFRHRVNTLRAAMRRVKHPDWEQLYRCGVYLNPLEPEVIVIAPRDSEFNDALRAAGFNVDDLERIEYTIPAPKVPYDAVNDPAEAFLSTLREATEPPKSEPEPDPEPDLDKL